MSVAKHGQRIVILAIVGVFFLTSLIGGVTVLYDAIKNKDNKTAASQSGTSAADLQKQIQDAQQQTAAPDTTTKKEGALQGTKLANFTPVNSVTSLQVTDLVVGTGKEASASSTVTAHYTGALASDGTIFQSSKDSGQQFTSALSGLIKGWQQGIPGMKEGGTRRLLIPADLAYGAQAQSGIPANSNLVFDIELSKVE